MRASLVTGFAIKIFVAVTLLFATQAADQPVVHAIFKTTDGGRSVSRSDTGLSDYRINVFGSLDDSILALAFS
jgi:hypothetical protein